MPTFVTAQTFFPSRDTRVSYGCRCLLIQGYFCAVLNYADKAELSQDVQNVFTVAKVGTVLNISNVITCMIITRRGEGGVLPIKLDRGVRPASQNPYPI